MSPVVLRVGKFVIWIFTRDHGPAHVHVISAEKHAKIQLNPIVVIRNDGFNSRELSKAVQIVEGNRDLLLAAWREYYPGHRE